MPAPIVMLVIAAAALVTIDARAQDDARVLAAGSLRAAMTEIGDAFRAASGATVAMDFGASGLLRERIEKGEIADVPDGSTSRACVPAPGRT